MGKNKIFFTNTRARLHCQRRRLPPISRSCCLDGNTPHSYEYRENKITVTHSILSLKHNEKTYEKRAKRKEK